MLSVMSWFYRFLLNFSMAIAIVFLPITEQAKAVAYNVVPLSAIQSFDLGVDELKSDRYRKALKYFTQAIEQDANLAAAYSNRCLVYLQLNEPAKSIEDCTAALQLNPENTEAYLNRGLAYYRQGNYPAAISEYNQIIERQSSDLRAYYNRGLARFELKDYEGAIADYNQGLEQSLQPFDPLLADIYNDRGLAELMLEEMEDAIADFSAAIYLDTNNHRAFYNRACACHRNGDLLGAVRDFTLALQLDPNRAEAYVNRGLIRHELGLQQAALADLKTASQRFNAQGNQSAYQTTLALIERLQKLLQSTDIAIG
jgi:tetratricopeptide (TPR) repeat protein